MKMGKMHAAVKVADEKLFRVSKGCLLAFINIMEMFPYACSDILYDARKGAFNSMMLIAIKYWYIADYLSQSVLSYYGILN